MLRTRKQIFTFLRQGATPDVAFINFREVSRQNQPGIRPLVERRMEYMTACTWSGKPQARYADIGVRIPKREYALMLIFFIWMCTCSQFSNGIDEVRLLGYPIYTLCCLSNRYKGFEGYVVQWWDLAHDSVDVASRPKG